MSLNDVQKIKDRLSVDEVIGNYLQLEKAGKNLKARCPFHNEKTPSFVVSPDRGTYYCFGCGAKGDAFSFVQAFEGVDFPSSLKILADMAGIELTKSGPQVKEKYNRLRSVLELTTKYFEAHFQNKPEIKKYLLSRGIESETIDSWRIGFAPNGWHYLYSFLKNKGFKDDEIEKAGLIKKNNRGEFYDRFRSRIIFPIFDSSGRVVAFTGRIFEGKQEDAKYLNSPETELFEKSKILYGFDRAKVYIRKLDFSILVEGQMDLILSHQAGYKNAVASSGTALTEDQLKLISRISDKVVIAYDSDSAGFRASEKAWLMALKIGLDVKIAPIQKGQDPADVILSGVENWKLAIKNARHIIEIITDKIFDEEIDERAKGKRVAKELVPYLANVSSNIDQAYFIKHVSEKLNIQEEAVQEEIVIYSKNTEPGQENSKMITEKSTLTKHKDLLKVERELFGILFWQEHQSVPVIKHNEFQDKIKEIIGDDYNYIFEILKGDQEALIFTAEQSYANLINHDGEIDKEKLKNNIFDLLKNLKLKYLLRSRDSFVKKLSDAENEKNEDDAEKYLELIQNVSKQINNLN